MDGPAVPGIVSDMQARKQLGLERYGSILQAYNGRDSLLDLYEELRQRRLCQAGAGETADTVCRGDITGL